MRVTDASLFQMIRTRMQNAQQRYTAASTSVTTGRKVNALGDDPLVVQQTLSHDREAADLSQFADSQRRMDDKYSVYETKIEEVYTSLSSLQQTMVQLSNPHQSEDVRAQLTSELEQTRDYLLAVANTEHEGQYIFAGARSDVEAFGTDGVYQGDSLEMEVEILPGVKLESNITGEALFGGNSFANGVNVFEMIDDLLDGIANGDPQTVVQSHLDEVDQLIEQTAQVRTQVGVRLNRVQMSQNTLSQLELTLAEKRQNSEEVDYVTALTEFKATEYALEATMQTTGNLVKPSLMNYIR